MKKLIVLLFLSFSFVAHAEEPVDLQFASRLQSYIFNQDFQTAVAYVRAYERKDLECAMSYKHLQFGLDKFNTALSYCMHFSPNQMRCARHIRPYMFGEAKFAGALGYCSTYHAVTLRCAIRNRHRAFGFDKFASAVSYCLGWGY